MFPSKFRQRKVWADSLTLLKDMPTNNRKKRKPMRMQKPPKNWHKRDKEAVPYFSNRFDIPDSIKA